MSAPGPGNLKRAEGLDLYRADEAILRGVLEADSPISDVLGPPTGPFISLFQRAARPDAAEVLREHETQVRSTPDARRGLELAFRAARARRQALALVPNEQLDGVVALLTGLIAGTPDLPGALAILIEDDPIRHPESSARAIAQRLGIPAIEVCDVRDLRTMIDSSMRMSRSAGRAVVIVVHEAILRSIETFNANPNRVLGAAEAATLGARRRRQRVPERDGVLRIARRLELNRFHNPPNPGERVPIGFVAAGPSRRTLGHILDVLGLEGQVPLISLGVVSPIDQALLHRVLTRCEHVLILEPRPGLLEGDILRIAERIRHDGETPAAVWGRSVPPPPDAEPPTIDAAEALHPSILVRRIVHLLHETRPTRQVATQLLVTDDHDADETDIDRPLERRELSIDEVRRILRHVADSIANVEPAEGRPRTRLELDLPGVPSDGPDRVIDVETWTHRRFLLDGLTALVQASTVTGPGLFVITEESGAPIQDLERVARSVIPANRAESVRIRTGNLADQPGLQELFEQATTIDGLTVVIVRDGPPAQYDDLAIERGLAEIDRLGYQPRQSQSWSADEACSMRPARDPLIDPRRIMPELDSLESALRVERHHSDQPDRFHMSVEAILEQVSVYRERPPAWLDASMPSAARLPTPKPMHGNQPQWRVQLAGVRGLNGGAASQVLCEAGRTMGYIVKCLHDPTPIGGGLRTSAQVLFEQPRKGDRPSPMTPRIPYGEADLLIALDATEARRAAGRGPTQRIATPGRTSAVVNVGTFEETDDATETQDAEVAATRVAIAAVTRSDGRFLEDVSSVCRSWFLTDRVTDVVLLGIAFQHGFVPITADAMDHALERVEARQFGRLREAFHFGRRLAVDRRLLTRPRLDRAESLERLRRRVVLSVRRSGRRGRRDAEQIDGMIRNTLAGTPGLAETDAGRHARRDLVLAVHHCYMWGGLDYAQRYADLIVGLYRSDRGDYGRRLTRSAVLALAEGMLIRDPMFVAAMATSVTRRLRIRRRLNVKHARGDRIERRFLTRLAISSRRRTIQLDVRTSDWPARMIAAWQTLIPKAWRGRPGRRSAREYVTSLISRAERHTEASYDQWAEALDRLHVMAESGGLHTADGTTLRKAIEPDGSLDA